MVFTHGIDSILRSIHEWTKKNLPDMSSYLDRLILKHNFKDGQGPVQAIPQHTLKASSTASTVLLRRLLVGISDEVGASSNASEVYLRRTLENKSETMEVSSSILAIEIIEA